MLLDFWSRLGPLTSILIETVRRLAETSCNMSLHVIDNFTTQPIDDQPWSLLLGKSHDAFDFHVFGRCFNNDANFVCFSRVDLVNVPLTFGRVEEDCNCVPVRLQQCGDDQRARTRSTLVCLVRLISYLQLVAASRIDCSFQLKNSASLGSRHIWNWSLHVPQIIIRRNNQELIPSSIVSPTLFLVFSRGTLDNVPWTFRNTLEGIVTLYRGTTSVQQQQQCADSPRAMPRSTLDAVLGVQFVQLRGELVSITTMLLGHSSRSYVSTWTKQMKVSFFTIYLPILTFVCT